MCGVRDSQGEMMCSCGTEVEGQKAVEDTTLNNPRAALGAHEGCAVLNLCFSQDSVV